MMRAAQRPAYDRTDGGDWQVSQSADGLTPRCG